MLVRLSIEIDADIGGRLGEAVGGKLAAISKDRQIIVVTHLPQIAALADRQFRVEKSSATGRTAASVKPLDGRDRLEELAEMLRGPKKAAEALDQPRKMLAAARGGRT
jgi:DNA repair protein RecN (Recombination protein N)